MNISQAFSIPAAGLDAQRERLNVISSNLANVDSTETPEGGPYRRRDVVFETEALKSDFGAMLDRSLSTVRKVKVSEIIEDQRAFKKVHEPGHPSADTEGYVLYPNVNPMEEMANMISALRSYEANVTVLDSIKSMAVKALEIGR